MNVWRCDKIFDVTALWEFFVKEGLHAAVTYSLLDVDKGC